MRLQKLKNFGMVLAVIFMGIMIFLRDSELVMLRNIIGYIFMGVFIVYIIILFFNRYR